MTAPMVDYKIHWLKMMSVPESQAVVGRHDGINGRDNADLRIATGLPVYFCEPHSPWQRGPNENTNGLLRQYFPKGTDLSAHCPDVLAVVADALNTRPRKTLGWRTPAEALDQCAPEHLLLCSKISRISDPTLSRWQRVQLSLGPHAAGRGTSCEQPPGPGT